MARKVLPVVKAEINDGIDWYKIASENWVLNQIKYIAPVLSATTANLTATYDNGTSGIGATLTNSGTKTPLTLDDVNLSIGDRVLVKDQTLSLENGIYKVTVVGSLTINWELTRVSDYDDFGQITKGDVIAVVSGTISSSSLWMLVTSITTIGTDSFVFAKTDRNSFTSILGTPSQIKVDVLNGVATISIEPNPIIPGTASITIPTGTTLQRPPTPAVGMIRINTDL
jgi:hypothetical protein